MDHLRPTIEQGDFFTCDFCGRVHVALGTHAEAMRDFRERSPLEFAQDDPRLVCCDVCWGVMQSPVTLARPTESEHAAA